jgi:hypothetical protein
MIDHGKQVKKYVATWHEPDPKLRGKAIAELWSDQAMYCNSGAEFHGHKGIEDAVTEAYEAFIQKGYEFRVTKADSNHDTVRYTWEMVPYGGGEVASIGTHFVEFDKEGRMVRDHQFVDMFPAM